MNWIDGLMGLVRTDTARAIAREAVRDIIGTAAAGDVLLERKRQREDERFDEAHDDAHVGGELAKAAACYALNGAMPDLTRESAALAPEDRPFELVFLRRYWPWEARWWKPRDRRRDLVRAAALLLAEIERLDRAAAKEAGGGA